MEIEKIKTPEGTIFYNASYIEQPPSDLFNLDAHNCSGEISLLGRGSVASFSIGDLSVVLKHYQRGGLLGKLIRDTYVYNGLHRARMVAEFFLLKFMLENQLPVPVPIAAKVVRRGPFYKGDLITLKLPVTQTLGQLLQNSGMDEALWRAVGQTVSQFHRKGVYHADLNANNIMMNKTGDIFLLDFDKSHIKRNSSGNWRVANLNRLLRSLNKLKLKHAAFYFDDNNWRSLLKGYEQAPSHS